MPSTTLQNIFGENATENSTQVIISKADLAEVGLDTYPDEIECQFAAILKMAWHSFQGELIADNGDGFTDDAGFSLGYDMNPAYQDINIRLVEKSNILSELRYWFEIDIFDSFEFTNNGINPITSDSQNVYIDKTLLHLPDSSIPTLLASFLDKLLLLNLPETVLISPPEEFEIFLYEDLFDLTSYPLLLTMQGDDLSYNTDNVIN